MSSLFKKFFIGHICSRLYSHMIVSDSLGTYYIFALMYLFLKAIEKTLPEIFGQLLKFFYLLKPYLNYLLTSQIE